MLRYVLLSVIIAAVVAFSVQNTITVGVSFLFWQFEAPLAVILFFAMLSAVFVMQLLRRWTIKRPGGRERP